MIPIAIRLLYKIAKFTKWNWLERKMRFYIDYYKGNFAQEPESEEKSG